MLQKYQHSTKNIFVSTNY